MPKRATVKVIPVPETAEEASQYLLQLGECQRAITTEETKLNKRIETLKQRSADKTRPHSQKADQLVQGLFSFAQANRTELTDDGKTKTIPLTTGELKWRTTPPKVTLRGVENILKALKAAGLERFIRTKEEVDKAAMLKEPEVASAIKGVTISNMELFSACPSSTEIGVEQKTSDLKKKTKNK